VHSDKVTTSTKRGLPRGCGERGAFRPQRDQRAVQLRISGPAARSLAEALPAEVAAAACAFITGHLIDGPRRVGTRLNPPLDPAWSASLATTERST
jgi:hypothetical protein